MRAAAPAVGVHQDAGYKWVRNSGLTMQRSTPRTYSPEDKAEFFRRLADNPNRRSGQDVTYSCSRPYIEKVSCSLPDLSVVIPTTGRTSLALAVWSALAQEEVEVEILICLGTNKLCSSDITEFLDEPRVRVIPLAPGDPPNANSARNNGISHARGKYVGLLDDDDIWFPRKSICQITALQREGQQRSLAVCSATVSPPTGNEFVWPTRPFKGGQRLAEYLFVRSSFRNARPFLQSSTFLARKELFEAVRFDPGLEVHQDWDFVLRAENKGYSVLYLQIPLVKYSLGTPGNTSSTDRNKWEKSYDWLQQIEPLLTDREYSECLLGLVSARAMEKRDFRGSLSLLKEAVSVGDFGRIGFLVSIARSFVRSLGIR